MRKPLPPVTATLALSLALALPTTAAAQDSRPAPADVAKPTQPSKPKKLTTPAMTIKSADMMVAMGLLSGFGSPDPLPKLEEGQHFVLELFGASDLKISTAKGEVGFATASFRPGLLLEVFDETIKAALGEFEPMALMGLGQVGIPAKDGAMMLKALVAFPKQIDRIDLKVTGDPAKSAKKLGIVMDLTPVKDTWLDKLVHALEPNDQGAPVLAVKDAAMSMSFAIKPDGLNTLAEPMLDLISSLGTKNTDERKRNREIMKSMMGAQDGSMTSAGDPFTSKMSTILGLRKPATVKEIMASEDFARLQKQQMAFMPMIDVEYDKVAFKHRDVDVSRMTIDMAATGMDQTVTRYDALAGNFMISYSGEGQEGAKRMIDDVLDQKIKRQPLPKGALMTVVMNLEKLFDQLAGMGVPAAVDEETPSKLNITLLRKPDALQLTIETR